MRLLAVVTSRSGKRSRGGWGPRILARLYEVHVASSLALLSAWLHHNPSEQMINALPDCMCHCMCAYVSSRVDGSASISYTSYISHTLLQSMGKLAFLLKAQVYAILACILYVLACLCLSHPILQRQYLFLHNVRIPMFAKFDTPELYGTEMGQVRNFRLESTDNITLGAWHFLPEAFYNAKKQDLLSGESELLDDIYDEALREYPTFVFLHGNGLNRAASFRVRTCNDISKHMQANVIAIDYRGYGDSDGYPTEQGVIDDAYAVVQYAMRKGYNPETDRQQGLSLVGQSLGTAIATQCALRMYRERQHLDALVLLAAFKELRPMITEFRMGGIVPMLKFLDYLPQKEQLLDNVFIYNFKTLDALAEIMNSTNDPGAIVPPVMILMHAMNDRVIDIYHSRDIFERMLEITSATKLSSAYQIWSSSVPNLGYVNAIVSKTARAPERRGLIQGARFVLPRSASFSLVQLEKGGHDHLLNGNVDVLQLMLPAYMMGNSAR